MTPTVISLTLICGPNRTGRGGVRSSCAGKSAAKFGRGFLMSKHPREPRSGGHDVVAALALASRDHQGVARRELPRMITLSVPARSLVKLTLPHAKWRSQRCAESDPRRPGKARRPEG